MIEFRISPAKHWHRWSVRRALLKYAIPTGRWLWLVVHQGLH
jgi:hypothetical protein